VRGDQIEKYPGMEAAHPPIGAFPGENQYEFKTGPNTALLSRGYHLRLQWPALSDQAATHHRIW